MKLLPRLRITHFVDGRSGEWRAIADPDAPATPQQLARLNRAGMLALVEPGSVEPLTKGEAAWAIDAVADDGSEGAAA